MHKLTRVASSHQKSLLQSPQPWHRQTFSDDHVSLALKITFPNLTISNCLRIKTHFVMPILTAMSDVHSDSQLRDDIRDKLALARRLIGRPQEFVEYHRFVLVLVAGVIRNRFNQNFLQNIAIYTV